VRFDRYWATIEIMKQALHSFRWKEKRSIANNHQRSRSSDKEGSSSKEGDSEDEDSKEDSDSDADRVAK